MSHTKNLPHASIQYKSRPGNPKRLFANPAVYVFSHTARHRTNVGDDTAISASARCVRARQTKKLLCRSVNAYQNTSQKHPYMAVVYQTAVCISQMRAEPPHVSYRDTDFPAVQACKLQNQKKGIPSKMLVTDGKMTYNKCAVRFIRCVWCRFTCAGWGKGRASLSCRIFLFPHAYYT